MSTLDPLTFVGMTEASGIVKFCITSPFDESSDRQDAYSVEEISFIKIKDCIDSEIVST